MDALREFQEWMRRNWDRASPAVKAAIIILLLAVAIFGIRACVPSEDLSEPPPVEPPAGSLPESVSVIPAGSTLSDADIDSSQQCSGNSIQLCLTRVARNGCTGPEMEQSGEVFLLTATAETDRGSVTVRSYCAGDTLMQAGCDPATGRIRFTANGPTDLACPGLRIVCLNGIKQYVRNGVPDTINIEEGLCP